MRAIIYCYGVVVALATIFALDGARTVFNVIKSSIGGSIGKTNGN